MKLIKNDGEMALVIKTRVTGSLKDSVARELMLLKPDPKDIRQQEILSKIQTVVDPAKPENTKINLGQSYELQIAVKQPYNNLEYQVIRENDAVYIRAFKLLVDTSKLNQADLDLFNTSELDEFWQNQDLNEVKKQLEFFRKSAQI